MVAISVVVTVYNKELYLNQCLDSIINQSFKDIEIICIDDNSSDSSLSILYEYKKKDKRIKIIENRKNLGIGTVRNIGLSKSKGKYLIFIDSDDWINHYTLERLYEKSEKMDLDILIYKMINYDEKNKEFFNTPYYDMNQMNKYLGKVFNTEMLCSDEFIGTPVSPCNKLYNKKFLENINAKFPSNLVYEDTPFFYHVMLNAKRISILNYYLYYRRIISSSVTKNKSITLDAIEITRIVFETFYENKQYNKFEKKLLNYLFNINIGKIRITENKYKAEYFERLKHMINSINEKYDLYEKFEKNLINTPKRVYESIIEDNYENFLKEVNRY